MKMSRTRFVSRRPRMWIALEEPNENVVPIEEITIDIDDNANIFLIWDEHHKL